MRINLEEIGKSLTLVSMLIMVWLVNSIFTLGIFVILLAGFKGGGASFIGMIMAVGYILLIYMVFLFSLFKELALFMKNGKEKEEKKKK